MGDMDRLLKFFEYSHLPEHLAEVSKPFSDLAHQMSARLKAGPERTVMFRKLLEAKDCAVRAELEMPVEPAPEPVHEPVGRS